MKRFNVTGAISEATLSRDGSVLTLTVSGGHPRLTAQIISKDCPDNVMPHRELAQIAAKGLKAKVTLEVQLPVAIDDDWEPMSIAGVKDDDEWKA